VKNVGCGGEKGERAYWKKEVGGGARAQMKKEGGKKSTNMKRIHFERSLNYVNKKKRVRGPKCVDQHKGKGGKKNVAQSRGLIGGFE